MLRNYAINDIMSKSITSISINQDNNIKHLIICKLITRNHQFESYLLRIFYYSRFHIVTFDSTCSFTGFERPYYFLFQFSVFTAREHRRRWQIGHLEWWILARRRDGGVSEIRSMSLTLTCVRMFARARARVCVGKCGRIHRSIERYISLTTLPPVATRLLTRPKYQPTRPTTFRDI